MSVFIEFVTDHFLCDRRITPPDDDMRAHTLAEAVIDFFRYHSADDTCMVLDLQRDQGVKLSATFVPLVNAPEKDYQETEKRTVMAFYFNRDDLSRTVIALQELQQSLCKEDELHPLLCCSYCVG